MIEEISYRPIGLIRSPFTEIKGMPIQPSGARGIRGTIEIYPEFSGGLKDLDGFSHIILLYHFHLSAGYSLTVKPFMDDTPRGVFSTRAPKRPNPIGLSVVRLREIGGNILHIEDIDVIDSTPLLDIKPFVTEFEPHEDIRIGWLAGKSGKVSGERSDGRFNI